MIRVEIMFQFRSRELANVSANAFDLFSFRTSLFTLYKTIYVDQNTKSFRSKKKSFSMKTFTREEGKIFQPFLLLLEETLFIAARDLCRIEKNSHAFH